MIPSKSTLVATPVSRARGFAQKPAAVSSVIPAKARIQATGFIINSGHGWRYSRNGRNRRMWSRRQTAWIPAFAGMTELTHRLRGFLCKARARRIGILQILLLLVAAGQVHAQAEPSPSPGDSAVEWIRPENVLARADALRRRLDAVQPDAAEEASIAQIDNGITSMDPNLEALFKRANAALVRSASLGEIADVRAAITAASQPLAEWKDKLAAEAKRWAELIDELAQGQRVWSATRDRPETAAAGDVVVRRVESALETLNAAAPRLQAWQARVLAVSDRVVDRSTAVENALAKLDAATVAEGKNLFVPNQPPLWRRGLASELRHELPRVVEEILAYNQSAREYAKRDARPLAVQALLAVILMITLRRFSIRARQRLASTPASSQAAPLLERPYAIALLLALLPSPSFHPSAPRQLIQMLAVIALFPAARIMLHATARANVTAFAGLFVLLFLDRAGLALAPLPAIARATFLLLLMIALGLAIWFGRRLRLAGNPPWQQRAVNLATVGVGLALLSELGGWTDLASLLGRAMIAGTLAAIYIYAAVIALEALLTYALASPTLRRSRVVDRNQALLQRRLQRAMRWIGAGLWLTLVLRALGLRSAAGEALSALLQASISVGALSLSLGGVLAFAVTILAAMLLAQIVTAVLELEVYPRTTWPRGVPYALSTLVRYGVYSLGFILALAAAGVELGQLSILLGGLGVGIGLGLQDVVKNFAAGLTLLFERRVQVGDAVQIPSQDIFGRVIAIGMRATVVRNFNGVEVVVPNADLVSGSVTNWTMSDPLHRIEVAVGVAYGTDPDRMVALLLDVARSTAHLLPEPAPQALFKGFGDNSLDFVLRAWTDSDYEPRTSELALAVHRALYAAGITIPFPQRDLHLASVSAEARAALADLDRKE